MRCRGSEFRLSIKTDRALGFPIMAAREDKAEGLESAAGETVEQSLSMNRVSAGRSKPRSRLAPAVGGLLRCMPRSGHQGTRPPPPRPGAAAQHLDQRIGKRRWLGKLQNVIVTHGVSLLRWKSGGSITPTIRRLNPSPRHQLLAIARYRSGPPPSGAISPAAAPCMPVWQLESRHPLSCSTRNRDRQLASIRFASSW